MVEQLCTRPSMWVQPGNYDSVAAYLSGYDAALEGGFLNGFREWLVVRADGYNSFGWPSIVVFLALADHENPASSLHECEANDEVARQELWSLYREYRNQRGEQGVRGIFHEYEKWLRKQSWYQEGWPDFLA